MEKNLTITTVTFNNLEYTKNFIYSLFATTKTPFKLIVVDNNSTDGTQNYLNDLQTKENVKVIFNSENTGFGPAHNKAFEICETRYIAPMNNDIVVPKYFIDRVFETFINNPEYKQLGAMQKKTVEETNKVTKESFVPKLKAINSPQNFVGGSFFIVEKELVNKVGSLFDEIFEIGFCEDVDLSWRIGSAGHKVGYITNLYYTHFGNTSFDKNSDLILSKSTYYIQNTVRLINKWNDVIKEDLRKQLSEGKNVEELIIVVTPFKERNFYKNCDQEQFKVDLIDCLSDPKKPLVGLINKYYKL